MSGLTIPTRAEDLEAGMAAIKAERPDLAASPDTLEGALVQAAADLSQALYYAAQSAANDAFPDSAMDDATVLRHAEWKLGPDAQKGATTSSKASALAVTGTLAGAAVTSDLTLVHTDGTRYQLTEAVTIGAATVNVGLISISTGTQCNKLTGDTLTFESPPANIDATATLVADLSGGLDQETIDALLGRVQDAIANPPAGGRFSDYKAWAETYPAVAQGYVYGPSSDDADGRRGVGVVDVAVLVTGSGTARQPTTDQVQDVQDIIDDERPETTLGTLVLRPDTDSQDVDVQLTPAPGFDWDYTENAETVDGYNAASLEIEISAPNATLAAAIDSVGYARIMEAGRILTVDLYTVGSGPVGGGDEIRLTATPTIAPTAPNPIYAAGPLTAPAQQAIEDLFDLLGPARGTAADPNQAWDDTLRLSAINGTLKSLTLSDGDEQGVPGVLDVTIVTPATNITPVDHGVGGTVDYLVPGTITVRPA